MLLKLIRNRNGVYFSTFLKTTRQGCPCLRKVLLNLKCHGERALFIKDFYNLQKFCRQNIREVLNFWIVQYEEMDIIICIIEPTKQVCNGINDERLSN